VSICFFLEVFVQGIDAITVSNIAEFRISILKIPYFIQYYSSSDETGVNDFEMCMSTTYIFNEPCVYIGTKI